MGGGDDLAYGGAGNDLIRGGDGDDALWGELGDDHIHGGTNDDLSAIGDFLTGGADMDVFYFQNGDSGGGNTKDVITDFASGEDLIVIDGDQANFRGQQAGFSQGEGAEIYYDHVYNQYLGWVTELHYRDDQGHESDLDIQLMGIQHVVEEDFFIH